MSSSTGRNSRTFLMMAGLVATLLPAFWFLTGISQCNSDVDRDDWTTDQGDCNDNDDTVYPGAPESCDLKDNDCNGAIDDGIQCSGFIATFAGDGSNSASGDAGDGGSALEAQIFPNDQVKDSSGNVFIADGTNRIRKVDTSGIISTVAGNGSAGYSGDGGQATEAQLLSPEGVALDGKGNIYIADYNNNRIRKVDTAGIITTVAGNGIASSTGDGGLATDASVYGPSDVALDGAGNIYIAEFISDKVRKVDTSGIITTYAGNGSGGYSGDGGAATSASLNSPTSVWADSFGNLFIADSANNRVRKVNSSGVISTVAGTGHAQSSGDGGLATSAQLNAPWHVVTDASGQLFISELVGARIRKVTTSGIISTIAGTGDLGYSGDGGPATSAELNYPTGIGVDSVGNVFIADSSNHRVRMVYH